MNKIARYSSLYYYNAVIHVLKTVRTTIVVQCGSRGSRNINIVVAIANTNHNLKSSNAYHHFILFSLLQRV
jgi:hypothetical protein